MVATDASLFMVHRHSFLSPHVLYISMLIISIQLFRFLTQLVLGCSLWPRMIFFGMSQDLSKYLTHNITCTMYVCMYVYVVMFSFHVFNQSRISRAERLFKYDVICSQVAGYNSNKQNDPIDDAFRGRHALASLPAGI